MWANSTGCCLWNVEIAAIVDCVESVQFIDVASLQGQLFYLKSLMSTTLLSVCPRERISRRLFRIKVIEDGFGFEIRELTVPRRGTVSMY